jgi:hypothetical protein
MSSEIKRNRIVKWAFAVLSPCYLLTGCDYAQPELDEGFAYSGGGGDGDGDGCGDVGPWSWTKETSDEYPPLSCPSGGAVHGVGCTGHFCDDVELHCMSTGHPGGENTWLPYFSEEEGWGFVNQGRCKGDDEWMTGISCMGSFCDNVSVQCSQILGSSTGTCKWSGWRSEEQDPFHSPGDTWFIKGIECDGAFCDRMRYRYCEML